MELNIIWCDIYVMYIYCAVTWIRMNSHAHLHPACVHLHPACVHLHPACAHLHPACAHLHPACVHLHPACVHGKHSATPPLVSNPRPILGRPYWYTPSFNCWNLPAILQKTLCIPEMYIYIYIYIYLHIHIWLDTAGIRLV